MIWKNDSAPGNDVHTWCEIGRCHSDGSQKEAQSQRLAVKVRRPEPSGAMGDGAGKDKQRKFLEQSYSDICVIHIYAKELRQEWHKFPTDLPF